MPLDFPDTPTLGQKFTGAGTVWTWDGTKWAGTSSSIGAIAIRVFTASGTYTPSPGMQTATIECVGGGGAGGAGVGSGAGNSQCFGGGGGGAGSYSRKFVTATQIGASQTVTIGAGGTGGTGNGGNGLDTSVGTLCIGKGGTGGGLTSSGAYGNGGVGGTVGTGDVTSVGAAGGSGVYNILSAVTGNVQLPAGNGGSTLLGGGGSTAQNTAGSSGSNGGGGGGGNAFNVATTFNGGNGGAGIVIITEFGAIGATGSVATAGLPAPVPLNINPAMQVSQEFGQGGSSTSPAAAVTYTIDGYLAYFTSGATFAHANSPTYASSPGGGQHIRIQNSAAIATPAAADLTSLYTILEGLDMAGLNWGTATARPIVIRFCFNAPVAGTYSVAVRNGAVNRSYIRTITISAAQVNTDATFYLTFPGDTAGTWTKDTTIGAYVSITFEAGSSYTTAPNIWTAGNFLAAPGQVNAITAANNVFYLSDFAVYDATGFGTDAGPPFVVPQYRDELLRCQRYFQTGLTAVGTITATAASQIVTSVLALRPVMRIAPTVTRTNVGDTGGLTITNDIVTADTVRSYALSTAAAQIQLYGTYKLNARL